MNTPSFKFGKYRGFDLRDIPTDYLEWALDTIDLWPRLRSAVVDELEQRREHSSRHHSSRRLPSVPILVEIVKAGRRSLALKYHPDHTGCDGSKMKLINSAADFLESHVQGIGS